MTYISSKKKIEIGKKEVSKNIFRDILKVNCPKCTNSFISEISFKISCPICGYSISGIKIPNGN